MANCRPEEEGGEDQTNSQDICLTGNNCRPPACFCVSKNEFVKSLDLCVCVYLIVWLMNKFTLNTGKNTIIQIND